MNRSDLPCLLMPLRIRQVLLVAGLVGLVATASAQLGASWKRQIALQQRCCALHATLLGEDGSGGLRLPVETWHLPPARLVSGSADVPAASMPSTASPAASAKPVTFEKTANGYDRVSFDFLSGFEFTPPDFDPLAADAKPPSGADQIPANVKGLDQRKVAVTGFMLPTKMEGNLVKEFLLVKDAMMCCYGAMPRVNEWIVVKMVGKGVKPLMDIPVTFEGKLTVGEMFENGYLTGIYLLDGEALTEVQD